MTQSRKTADTARQRYSRFALACWCVSAFGSVPVLAQGPANKIAISALSVAQKNRPPSKEDPAPQGSFSQQVGVAFKTAVPPDAHLDDVTKWKVTVNFDDDSTAVLLGKINNCITTPATATCWVVIITTRDGSVTEKDAPQQLQKPPVGIISDVTPFGAVITLPEGTLTKHLTTLIVDFGGAQSPPLSVKEGQCVGMFCAATNKGTSDNYLSGSYSPAIHSAAQYTIDGKGSYVHQIGLSPFYVGGIATVSTDQRPTADPDSFLVSGVLQIALPRRKFNSQSFWGSRVQGAVINWEFAGLEFDRKTTIKTFISSPIVEIPFRVYESPKKKIRLGMFQYMGIETGTNLSNALNPNGSGFVFRGEVGTSIGLNVKTGWKRLSEIAVTSNYTARIPAVDEIFTNTHYISATGKTVSLYTMSTQVRNHLKDEIDFTVAKPVSITIKHEYGELPPGFRTIQNKVTIGLTIMLFQNNTASSSISAE